MKKSINLPQNTALILIDVQKGFDEPQWGTRNNKFAEKNMAKILKVWREKKLPIFHVKNDSTELNSPLRPEKPGNAIKDIVKPIADEPIITKTVNSAFIGTTLEKKLREKKTASVVIVGLTTDHCVSTTARMADNLGFKTYVISDATATFDRLGFNKKYYSAKKMHEQALVSLQDEFATILDTKSLIS